ncbi:glycosyltransferase family 4 protein [Actinomycetes bacterium M1A6_2h]
MTAHRPRIALLTVNYWPEPSGVSRYTTSLAEGMAARGFDVKVVTGFPHYPSWTVDASHPVNTIRNGVQLERLHHYVPHKPSPSRRTAMELDFGRKLARSDWMDRDVVLCTSPPLLSASLVAARIAIRRRARRRTPAFGMWVQDLYGRAVIETDAMTGRLARSVTAIEASTMRSADRVAVIHEGFGTHLATGLGVSPRKIDVIRNWSHVAPPTPDKRTSTRAALGWGEGETIVLHAGNMGAKQGLSNVLDAARLADRDNLPVRFVLLGDGHERDGLEENARGIRHLEWLDSIPDDHFVDTLAAADVLLVNEKPGVGSMSLPSKLTSYFAAGTPVLAASDSNSLTARELGRSGAGTRVPPGDPRALVTGALELANNTAKSASQVTAGLRYSSVDLSERVALDHFENWISRLHDAVRRARDGRLG